MVPPDAGEPFSEIGIVSASDSHVFTSGWRMDEAAVTEIDTVV